MPWDRMDSMDPEAEGRDRLRDRPTVAVDQPSVRLGLRLVRGLPESEAKRLVEAVRRDGPFHDLERLRRSSGLRSRPCGDWLARTDSDHQLSHECLGLTSGTTSPPLEGPGSSSGGGGIVERVSLPRVCRSSRCGRLRGRRALRPSASGGLSQGRSDAGVAAAARNRGFDGDPEGSGSRWRGWCSCGSDRPPPNVFMTLEDETGIANLVLKPKVYEGVAVARAGGMRGDRPDRAAGRRGARRLRLEPISVSPIRRRTPDRPRNRKGWSDRHQAGRSLASEVGTSADRGSLPRPSRTVDRPGPPTVPAGPSRPIRGFPPMRIEHGRGPDEEAAARRAGRGRLGRDEMPPAADAGGGPAGHGGRGRRTGNPRGDRLRSGCRPGRRHSPCRG